MSTKIFNIAPNQLIPTSRVNLRRDEEGLWSADHIFLCRYVDYGNTALIEKLTQGVSITTLDPNIPDLYSFITLEDHEFQHNKGGITEIRARFTGYSETDGFTPGDDGRSKSSSYRGTIGRTSILLHPLYRYEVTDENYLAAIASYYNSEALLTGNKLDGYIIIRKDDDYDWNNGLITDDAAVKWIAKIEQGTKDYESPLIEWTVSESNLDGMDTDDLARFSLKVDDADVPGNPPKPSTAPPDAWWHFSDLSEDKTDGSSSWSRTYTLRTEPLDDDLYNYTIPSGP